MTGGVVVGVIINGDAAEVEEGRALLDLLADLGVEPARVVVEHNRRVLRRADLEGATVAAGDEIEIVQFVGGG